MVRAQAKQASVSRHHVQAEALQQLPAQEEAMKKPSEINITIPFTAAFKKAEAEYLAVVIVLFAQKHGDTFDAEFDFRTIAAWFVSLDSHRDRSKWFPPFMDPQVGLDALFAGDWLHGNPKAFRVSENFVERCYLSGARRYDELRGEQQ